MPRKMPVGIQSFRKLREGGYYYTDKTGFIDDFLLVGAEVTLITRPRRFGKSLLLDMVREFFDVTKDSYAIFEGLKVMGGDNANLINGLPVLYFSFKDCDGDSSAILGRMADVMRMEFIRYRFVCESLSPENIQLYNEAFSALVQKNPGDSLLHSAIETLSRLVSLHFSRKVLILIDEYDAPMMSAFENGCYGELRSFFRNLLSTALKGNEWMDRAILTGVQRIAKEGVLSGLNNLDVCTVAHSLYSGHFRFTESETKALLENCGLSLDEDVRQKYNGYRFGESQLYNPCAITNYARSGRLAGYWSGTAGDGMLVEKMRAASPQFMDALDGILSEGSALVEANLETAVYEDDSDAAVWGLFVNAGYLTFADTPFPESETFTLRIPNGEVRRALLEVIRKYYGAGSYNAMIHLFRPLLEGRDTAAFESRYKEIVLKSTSHHDRREYAYHLLMLGMCMSLDGYEVASNREAGHGLYDILLRPKTAGGGRFCVIIEYKQGGDTVKLAGDAIEQIKRMEYVAELEGEVLLVGIAHDGKRCSLKFEWTDN